MSELDGPARNREIDRRREGESIENGGDPAARVAALLASLGRTAATGLSRPETTWTVEALTATIVTTASRLVPGATVTADLDLFDVGASSVTAVELVSAIEEQHGVRLDLDDVFADARPRSLAAKFLAAAGAPIDDLDLIAADLALANDLPWSDPPRPVPPRTLLLTGATGFLGGHLLLDLLRQGDAHVVCVVRGTDDNSATHRLGEALTRYDLPWSAEVRRRTTVLAGDLRQPRLGLPTEVWDRLTMELDAVVGVAAAVDFLRGYASLRQSNVVPVHTLAKLAMTGRPKPLHHVSSMAVFNEVGIAAIGEDDPLAHVTRLVAGYDRSKWAAEALLRRARERGLTATVLRPGSIGGHTETGAYNPRDLSTGLLAAVSRYRIMPAFRHLNVAPVDWVSRLAAAIVHEPDGWGRDYHLTGRPNTMPEMIRDLDRAGTNVAVLDWEGWRADVLARVAADPVPGLDFLARMLRSSTAAKLCEAVLDAPATTGRRAEAFAARHDLPAPVRYGLTESRKMYERMAVDGLHRLPGREDPPYLWFPETMRGKLGPSVGVSGTPCAMRLTLSISSMYQLVRGEPRTLDVRDGFLSCRDLHERPLRVESGEVLIRPDDGVPRQHGLEHPLMRYRLELRDDDGRAWWLDGWKTARPRRDLWKQARTLAVEIGRPGEPAMFAGVLEVPARTYLRDQVDQIRVDPALSGREQRLAKAAWLAWFLPQVGRGLLEPGLRVVAELLDLRRDAIDRQADRDREQDRRAIRKRTGPR